MKLSNNEINLIGFAGKDAEGKQTKNRTNYTVVSLATRESWKDKQSGEWRERTTWFRLVGWGKTAEAMLKLTKGAFIQVRGSIRNYELPGKDGKPGRQVTEVVVSGFAKLDRTRRGEAVPEGAVA
jgi:single-strand DNA-binding protein